MLTLAIFTPLLGALALASIPKVTEVQARVLAVVMATLPLLLLLGVWWRFDPAGPMFQSVAEVPWIPSLGVAWRVGIDGRSEAHKSELQSIMSISYAVLCLKT